MSKSKKIGLELCKLSELLWTYGLCKDISPLETAGNSCISKSTDDVWRYNLNKIVFSADDANGRIPAKSEDIQVSLSISILGKHYNDDEDVSNPLETLEFNIEVEGSYLNEKTDKVEDLYSAWHLDRHISSPQDGTTKYSHPLYHLAYGGNKMELKGEEFGISLIMPSPRFLYPPMDAALGIDFILQNYKEQKSIKKLIDDPSYIEIMRNSQKRLWKPFFSSIYSFWNAASHKTTVDFAASKLLPLYY